MPVDEPIQGQPPAQGAIGQFLEQLSVERGPEMFLKGYGQQIVEKTGPIFPLLKETNGNFSWFLARHSIIMSGA